MSQFIKHVDKGDPFVVYITSGTDQHGEDLWCSDCQKTRASIKTNVLDVTKMPII
jgi:hypothetical protein